MKNLLRKIKGDVFSKFRDKSWIDRLFGQEKLRYHEYHGVFVVFGVC